jgi:outer membrane receptor protein involved in Fe transport
VDVNVGYAYNKNLSFQLEAINLTDQLQRVHGRTDMMVLSLAQSGPRYMLSARYKF